jgi:transcription elongation GreA/GreB family factor
MQLELHLKRKLLDHCFVFVNTSITGLKMAIDDAQEGANSETKGSAGDKHETGRAMMHLENEMNSKQLAERLKLLQVLELINPDEKHGIAQLGSLVKTTLGTYYLSIGIGKVEIEGNAFLIISPSSPIGALLMKTREGSEITFNGKSILVEEVI